MEKHCKQTIRLLVGVLGLMIFLSACGGNPTPQPSASATPEAASATLPEATPETALPTPTGSSDSTTVQPAATLPLAFDLTRTEDNPITDAQQIVEILEALESIERAQPVSPGWYLRTDNDLIDPDNLDHIYDLYHVIDEELNCDLAMHFMLSPDGNSLGLMVRNYGTHILSSSFRGPIVRMEDSTSYVCNLSNPNLAFFSDYSDTFSMTVQRWLEPGTEQWGDYSFSAWFESEDGQTLFVLQEDSDNMRLAYQTDPDTKELVATESDKEKITYSVDTGLPIGNQYTAILMNGKTKNRDSFVQRVYYLEMDELPTSVLVYLEESLRTYDELQLP